MRTNGTRWLLLAGVIAAIGGAGIFRPLRADTGRRYQIVDLGTLGGSESTATGLNAAGQVVGVSDLPGDTATHAFLYSEGRLQDLGTLGGSTSLATDINSAGQVVGSAETAAGLTHAFLYRDGKMTDLGRWAAHSASRPASTAAARSPATRTCAGIR